MNKNLLLHHHDLVSPDGWIQVIKPLSESTAYVEVIIENIPSHFLGFSIDHSLIIFNLKSTLAQLGLTAYLDQLDLSQTQQSGVVFITLKALSDIGKHLLKHLETGMYIGKLFAADERRRVRESYYLSRMFDRVDQHGNSLLSFGSLQHNPQWELKTINGRIVAFLPIKEGCQNYSKDIFNYIPFITQSLKHPDIKTRRPLRVLQKWNDTSHTFNNNLLLVNTNPLHIRTVFAHVVNELLPNGITHTAASILQPDTAESGNIFELYGTTNTPPTHIPLEFYTLEPYKEHVFFSDRDQLQTSIEDVNILIKAFGSAPTPLHHKCATFIVKGSQLENLTADQWGQTESIHKPFPGFFEPYQQIKEVEKYMYQQPSYMFLEAIENEIITSEGILLTRFFPSPIMKRMLLSKSVQTKLKGIYFLHPSRSHGDFFSDEDRAFLIDLAKFGIPIYWLNKPSQQLLRYVPRSHANSGMFVPLHQIEIFRSATMLGIYGSNLIEGDFSLLLEELIKGLLQMKESCNHPLLNISTPLALVTGGGPGAMSVGNQIAKKLSILSCANILDFRTHKDSIIHEQKQNPYIEAKMTYRLDKLVERQAEFHLDLPIFLTGGIGTDFEYSIEETRRKIGVSPPSPVLLLGDYNYWKQKLTHRFHCNRNAGTITGSEWISNCFFCIQNAQQGLEVYKKFFTGSLDIGPNGPISSDGFRTL